MSHLPEKIIILSFGVLLLTNIAFKMVLRHREQKILGVQTQQEVFNKSLDHQKSYWLDVVSTNPDYRDGYLKLAEVTWHQNNLTEAKMWVTRALEIDPNYILPTPLLSLLN